MFYHWRCLAFISNGKKQLASLMQLFYSSAHYGRERKGLAMRHDQTNETASGAGYERLMARMKAEARYIVREPASFKHDRDETVEADGRAQFGKRRNSER